MQVEVARRKPRETARWLVICLDKRPPGTRNSRKTALWDQSESILTQGSATRHICVKKLNSHQSLTPPGFACVTTKADNSFLSRANRLAAPLKNCLMKNSAFISF